ncbi:hypothetical protein CHS0354_015830 [Potamilus streckersoni]|uniref:Uncharacterized protein n=1 Tax=Potamilus streckersoni TaxID=2493646 RepID=A0AAE0SDB7_9BIVA|nr:hypothetical protein CHS0354_015830 [Potamilus streckersoni]
MSVSGGTADMTVHERLDDGRLKELLKASGGLWGGREVDNAFKNLMISIVQTTVMNSFKINYGHHFLDLFNDFEAVKRTYKQGEELRVRLPSTLVKTCHSESKMNFKQCLEESVHSKEIDVDNKIDLG